MTNAMLRRASMRRIVGALTAFRDAMRAEGDADYERVAAALSVYTEHALVELARAEGYEPKLTADGFWDPVDPITYAIAQADLRDALANAWEVERLRGMLEWCAAKALDGENIAADAWQDEMSQRYLLLTDLSAPDDVRSVLAWKASDPPPGTLARMATPSLYEESR